jgi:hypothetical protein
MTKNKLFSIFLLLWAAYEFINALLSTVLLTKGANLFGFSEWILNPNIRFVFYQYGVMLLVLALFYFIASQDAVKYAAAAWVVIAEQAIGSAFTIYAFASGATDLSQMMYALSISIPIAALVWFIKPAVTPSPEPSGVSTQVKLLQGFMWIWASFSLLNGLLSSVLLAQGASLYGTGDWLKDDRIIYVFHLYAMTLFTLAVAYGLIATDILRYEKLLLVYGVEQFVSVFLSVYFAAERQISAPLFWGTIFLQFISIVGVFYLQSYRKNIVPARVRNPNLN